MVDMLLLYSLGICFCRSVVIEIMCAILSEIYQSHLEEISTMNPSLNSIEVKYNFV